MDFLCELYSAELGNGWGSATLETTNEYDFVKQGQRSFHKSDPYWMGGTTDMTLGATVTFSDYIHGNSGK